jgi:2,3-diketo-5-methylthio-1-phosphopentane phosphatase
MTRREVSSEGHSSWQVLVDFDGTIAPDDPTDRLFERYADPHWRVIEEQWNNGLISSRECMQHQVDLLRVSPEAIDEAIRVIRIDPTFRTFLNFCYDRGADVKIVSDGLDRMVEGALRNARLAVPYFANKLEWRGGDRWRLVFPHARDDCRVSAANCKCSHGNRPHLRPRIVVGDGRSDFCMSLHADYVIAKGALARFCRDSGRPFATFVDFQEATVRLTAWLNNRARIANPAPAPGSL